MHTLRFIGPGRAGTSLAAALSARGWAVAGFLGRHDDLSGAARGVDVLVIATPDDAIAEVAAAVTPVADHDRRAPLGLPRPRRPGPAPAAGRPAPPGARCPTPRWVRPGCAAGVTFAVAGAPVAQAMVGRLGGRPVEVADDDRAAYHAAACIAANHVVALLGQVERVAASVGLDLEAFLPLTRAAVDDVAALGAAAALTGPARRGDWATLSRHLDALPEGERAGYQAGPPPGWPPGWPARPCRRRCSGDGRGRDARQPAATRSMRPGPPAGPSAWCPPWARSTPATFAHGAGPAPSATWWR